MIIRYATIKDIPAIANLWVEMVKELAPDYKPNKTWWVEQATKLLETNIYISLIAVSGDEVIGFIDAFLYPEPSTGKLHLVGQHFYVQPGHRGTDVAPRLYHEVLRFAKKNKVDILELFCFDSEKSMWQRKGFKSVRTLMRRSLCLTR